MNISLIKKPCLKWAFFIVLVAVVTFFSHVFIQELLRPLLPLLSEGIRPEPEGIYPQYIVLIAFLTAIIQVGVTVLVYYHVGHLLPIKNRLLKALAVAAILLEIKGYLIRYTVVGGFELARLDAAHPILYIFVDNLDIWIPNLIVAFALVFICPMKYGVRRGTAS